MKVLIIVTSANVKKSFGNSNYNEQEIGLARALLKHGIECGIAYYGKDQEKRGKYDIGSGTVTMYLLKGKDFLKTVFFKNYKEIYDEYDIIMPISYDHFETYRLAMRYPQKVVVYHGTYYSSFNKRYNFKCRIFDTFLIPGYKKANTPFVTKNKLAARFLNEKGITNTKVIGVGFDAAQMESKKMLESPLSESIKKYKEQGDAILLYVGRLEPRRNIIFLLELFRKIVETHNAKLVIVGNGREEYKKKCFELAHRYDLEKNILYQEKLEQKYLPLIYKMADLFLLPTSYDIFGMVILEAMYFGTPVLTTRNGGSDILIEDGTTGYIVPKLNVTKWFEKVSDILAGDTDQLTEAAHRKIADEFTWDTLADKFIEAYNKRLGRARM